MPFFLALLLLVLLLLLAAAGLPGLLLQRRWWHLPLWQWPGEGQCRVVGHLVHAAGALGMAGAHGWCSWLVLIATLAWPLSPSPYVLLQEFFISQ